MTHGSLFSGIGGFDLAAEWMGWTNNFHCEWNPFGQKILKHYWPNATSYNDITETDFTVHRGTIDILTGGFPCQGFSLAGNRLGTDDDRYLWPEMLRVVEETKPPFIIGENVTGILSMEDKSGIYRDVFAKVEGRQITRLCEVDYYEAIYTRQAKMLVNSICEDLEKRGYEVQPMAIPAASVGAPHKRERIWFIAHTSGNRWNRKRPEFENENRKPGSEEIRELERGPEGFCIHGTAANTNSQRQPFEEYGEKKSGRTPKKSIPNDWQNFPTQSPICDGDDGLSSRLDGITFSKWRNESIKAGGNAIVPQVAFEIFKAIETYSKQNNQQL